jgi:hypothetical protein
LRLLLHDHSSRSPGAECHHQIRPRPSVAE